MTENSSNREEYLPPKQVAEIVCSSIRKLERDRVSGTGIPFVRFGGKILYRRSDLDKFMAARVVASTSEYAPVAGDTL